MYFEEKYSAYTITKNGKGSEYPLTHIAVFNFESSCEPLRSISFREKCKQAEDIAKEHKLECIFVNTNFGNLLTGKLCKVHSFWNLAGALALQRLFAVYLIPAEYDAAHFKIDLERASYYDLLTVNYASTESLCFYLSGREAGEEKKQNEDLENKRHSIHIGIPYIQELSGEARLCAKVKMGNKEELMWFSVKESYERYLTVDRADAFVAGLLTTAMRNEMDIKCEAPVTKRLLYQINHYLIPMMSGNISCFHRMKVCAKPTEKPLECAEAVGTGWTSGVDSMFTCMQNLHTEGKKHKLTHLLITSNGAIEGECCKETLDKMVEKAENGFASENGLEVVGIDTNLQEILSETFISVQPFRHASVVLALQKLFGVFLNSSSDAFSKFSFFEEMAGYYELAPLACFETECTVFYSSGGAFSRGQKLKELSGFLQAYKYLHPCIYALRDNCGECNKCIRTEAVLYGFGTLEKFSVVFDVKKFERNKSRYFAQLLIMDWNPDCQEAVNIFQRRKMSLFFHIRVRGWLSIFKARAFLKRVFSI